MLLRGEQENNKKLSVNFRYQPLLYYNLYFICRFNVDDEFVLFLLSGIRNIDIEYKTIWISIPFMVLMCYCFHGFHPILDCCIDIEY